MTATITLTEIETAPKPRSYRFVDADNFVHFEVIAITAIGPIVRGSKGQLGRVVQTGKKLSRADRVRVRIEFATDTGDSAGTLSFDRKGATIGGRVEADVFYTPDPTASFDKGFEYEYAFTVPGLPGVGTLTEIGVLDEIAENWVSFRPYGSDNLYVFGTHPEAVAPLTSLRRK